MFPVLSKRNKPFHFKCPIWSMMNEMIFFIFSLVILAPGCESCFPTCPPPPQEPSGTQKIQLPIVPIRKEHN